MGLVDDALLQEMVFNADPDLMPGVREVTLRFKSGTTRAVNAQVFEYEIQLDDRRGTLQVFLVGLAADATSGMTAAEFDNNGVDALLSFRGGTASYRTLRWPTEGDPVPVNEPVDSSWVWFVAN